MYILRSVQKTCILRPVQNACILRPVQNTRVFYVLCKIRVFYVLCKIRVFDGTCNSSRCAEEPTGRSAVFLCVGGASCCYSKRCCGSS